MREKGVGHTFRTFDDVMQERMDKLEERHETITAGQNHLPCRSLADRVPGYLARREADIQDIERALAADDFQRIQKLGHDMKGSGSSYGFCRITEIGGDLESQAKAGTRTEIAALLRDLDSYVRGAQGRAKAERLREVQADSH